MKKNQIWKIKFEQLLNLLQRTLIKAASENNRTNVNASMITEENIYDFRHQDGPNENEKNCKCRFTCPYCIKTFALSYNKFWISSKVTNHIKKTICVECTTVRIRKMTSCEHVNLKFSSSLILAWILALILFQEVDSFILS